MPISSALPIDVQLAQYQHMRARANLALMKQMRPAANWQTHGSWCRPVATMFATPHPGIGNCCLLEARLTSRSKNRHDDSKVQLSGRFVRPRTSEMKIAAVRTG